MTELIINTDAEYLLIDARLPSPPQSLAASPQRKEAYARDSHCSAAAVNLGNKIFVQEKNAKPGECPIKDLHSVLAATKDTLERNALPFFDEHNKRASVRIIEAKNSESFLREFEENIAQFEVAKQAMLEGYDAIRESDKESLGDNWPDVEDRYPPRSRIESMKIALPAMAPFRLGDKLVEVSEQVQEKINAVMQQKLQATVNNIEQICLEELSTALENLNKASGYVCIVGNTESEYAKWEVLDEKHNEEANTYFVRLQQREESEGKLTRIGKPVDLVLGPAAHQALQISATSQKRRLGASNIEGLFTVLDKVSNAAKNGMGSGELREFASTVREQAQALREKNSWDVNSRSTIRQLTQQWAETASAQAANTAIPRKQRYRTLTRR